jgi:hypothetical protein
MLPDIATALVPINSTAWIAAQHFSYGARGFMRVPVSEANDLNYWLGSYWLPKEKYILLPFSNPHSRFSPSDSFFREYK